MIGVIDYGMGNLGSVKRKLDRLKVDAIISDDKAVLKKCTKLILPGIGHFENGVVELKTRNLWDFLSEEVLLNKKPILGICLGMQLFAKRSEEGGVEGLGWIDANVVRFRMEDHSKYKVPHIGWNDVALKKSSDLFKDIPLMTGFYFVHSYHIQCSDCSDILNETVYGYPFTSAVQRENIIGVQYHPEKSHEEGEQLLKNFCA